MNSSDSIPSKKFFSDDDKSPCCKNYIKENKIKIEAKFKEMTYATDYPLSMTNGDLFTKFSIEYIKNIIFEKKSLKFKENAHFNFFDYIKLFTESEHSKKQKELLKEIIVFKNGNIKKDEYLNKRDFDVIIDTVKGSDILNILTKHKFNIYHYPGEKIKEDAKYCVICEIKSDFFKQIKDPSIQKQFRMYQKILKLLLAKPNLERIKDKIGLNRKNELLFMLATNGDYYQFDYMRFSALNFKEDNFSDVDSKYNIPAHLKNIDEISKLNIPVLLLFVPRTLDDKSVIFKNKYVTKMEKVILGLNKDINKLRREIDNINKTLNIRKDDKESDNKMLNQKRERGGDEEDASKK